MSSGTHLETTVGEHISSLHPQMQLHKENRHLNTCFSEPDGVDGTTVLWPDRLNF